MKKWNLKAQAIKKFYLRHPWVFSNDLKHSPKNLNPGELVELYNEAGDFLARGYGHPNTLICFRVLTRDVNEQIDEEFFLRRFTRAYEKRKLANIHQSSFRFIFAEADFLPGLIIDRYKLHDAQVFVLQSSTAGMEQLLPQVMSGIEKFVRSQSAMDWDKTAIIFANDSKSRLIEGIAVEPKQAKKEIADLNLADTEIEIASATRGLAPIYLKLDFLGGQKTGFFLDQRSNIEMLIKACLQKFSGHQRPLRVLDLCCYNGQWSSQIANLLNHLQIAADYTLVDASEKALALAKKNVERYFCKNSSAQTKKLDVLKELGELADQSYDIVICDPPAFIKKRQDVENGERAYVKLNRDAIKKVSAQGLFVSCSCSGYLDDLKFREVLLQASAKTGRNLEWMWRGTHSPDHPELAEFPQGTYLKSWLGWMP